MEELKPWWASKAIWTGVIGSLWGVAGRATRFWKLWILKRPRKFSRIGSMIRS